MGHGACRKDNMIF